MDKKEKPQTEQVREQINREALEMLPEAMDALRDIINDPDVNPIARVQAVALLMDRGLGKPEENIRIQYMQSDMDEAQERLTELKKDRVIILTTHYIYWNPCKLLRKNL